MVIDRTLVNQICPAAADAGWPHPELHVGHTCVRVKSHRRTCHRYHDVHSGTARIFYAARRVAAYRVRVRSSPLLGWPEGRMTSDDPAITRVERASVYSRL